MTRTLVMIGGGLAVLVFLVIAIGYALPVAHVASGRRTIARPRGQVFRTISDVPHYPEWRRDVTRVEVLAAAPLRWREHGANGEITFVTIECSEPARFVTRIDDPALPFGGTWTFDLADDGGATVVTITEHGEVFNPVFRVMSRFIFGHTATINAYLDDLSAGTAKPPAE